MNKVLLSGRLTADPELKQTNSGKSYCFFTLACTKFTNNEQGADYVSCVAWERTADNICRYIRKGGRINVVGKLQTRKNNNNVYIMEVVAESVEFIDTKPAEQKVPRIEDFNGDIDIPY